MNNKGVTFIELIIAMAILAIIIVIVIPSLSGFQNQQVLRNTTDDIASLINKARMQTLSSQNSINYGVHFDSNHVTLFTGPTYSEGGLDNEIISFENNVEISLVDGINLNGGGADVIFVRLTGETNQYGIITVELSSDNSKQKIITISQIGIVSVN